MQNGPDSLTIEQRQAIEEYVKLDRRKQDIRRQKSGKGFHGRNVETNVS
jgi:hypothetical protein